jgi:hypothetical protein
VKSPVLARQDSGCWLTIRSILFPLGLPVFKEATVAEVFAVERVFPTQIHWPALDADIELEAWDHPERFPLVFK